MPSKCLYGVYEFGFQSIKDYDNPLWYCQPLVAFTSPSGRQMTIRAFWDGGRDWRVRFSPDEVGEWSYSIEPECASDFNLKSDKFECVPYNGDNRIYQHGPLKLSSDQRSIEHADGTPFFWLADTAWNGVIRGDDANWERYLDLRIGQRFTAIQFVCSHWRGDVEDPAGEASCTEEHPIEMNPRFFQRIDHRVAMINEKGMIAAPVMIWSLLETDLGFKLPEEDSIKLASYIEARYGAYQVVWLLGGDGDYEKMGYERWRNIGRGVFKYGHERLATLHPCGQTWPNEQYRNEGWFDINGYQSGHGDGEEDLEWLVKGPSAVEWKNEPALPVINLEPNYETAHGYQHHTVLTDFHVRRGAWWSLLVSPTAGVTYGHDSIWNWNFETGPSEGHGGWHGGAVPPWTEGLETPGIDSMTMMRNILDTIEWQTLLPCPEIIISNPGDSDINRFVVASQNAKGVVVIYSPDGGEIAFKDNALSGNAKILNPFNGEVMKEILLVDGKIELEAGRDYLIIAKP